MKEQILGSAKPARETPEDRPVQLCGTSTESIALAAERLAQGELVAFPTETVYGLGADARNPEALARIFQAKGRPTDHPMIVHLGQAEQMTQWARDIPSKAWRLAEHFWPGPLTLILKRAPQVPTLVTGGQDTVGLRVPHHPVALSLLRKFGSGLAAPSANRFGCISPTTAAHVMAEMGEAVACVLDGGPCAVGLESTILDLSGTTPRLLRPGAVVPRALAGILGELPMEGTATDAPRVSGSLTSHYAPQTPLRLLEAAAIVPTLKMLLNRGQRVAVLAIRPPAMQPNTYHWLAMPPTADAYAQQLYACLHEADLLDCDTLLAERPPTGAEWSAIQDRLGRAAAVRPDPGAGVEVPHSHRAHGLEAALTANKR